MGHKSWARELGALVGRMSDGRMKDERARDNKNVRWKVISPDKSELPAESPPDEALLILLRSCLKFIEKSCYTSI